MSQSKSERFEEVLKVFQNNFLSELGLLNPIEECLIHKSLHKSTIYVAEKLHDSIRKIPDLIDLFNEVRAVYQEWIKGHYTNSINKLNTVLDDKGLNKSSDEVSNLLFFRGRTSETILTREDLYHIPFNKRYLIKNQRYSVAGQPMLYLGLSPLTVIFELRRNIDDLRNVYFCSYIHKASEKLKVLDTINKYPNFFTNYEINVLHGTPVSPEPIFDKANFYQFIMSQFCSFKRSRYSEGNVFAEEYVIPQVLTELLRNLGYSGILFSSTRADDTKVKSKAVFHANRHRENVALFTNYSETNNFDENLINNFFVSKTLTIDDCQDFTENEWSSYVKQIGKIRRRNPSAEAPFELKLNEITGISSHTLFKDIFIEVDGTEVNYFDHPIGKIHRQFLIEAVIELRNQSLLLK